MEPKTHTHMQTETKSGQTCSLYEWWIEEPALLLEFFSFIFFFSLTHTYTHTKNWFNPSSNNSIRYGARQKKKFQAKKRERKKNQEKKETKSSWPWKPLACLFIIIIFYFIIILLYFANQRIDECLCVCMYKWIQHSENQPTKMIMMMMVPFYVISPIIII